MSLTAVSGSAQPPLPPGLRRLVWAVRVLAVLGGLSLLAVPLSFWSQPDWIGEAGRSVAGLPDSTALVVDDRARGLGLLSSVPGIGLGLWALLCLWRLFGAYAQGRFFDGEACRQLRRFAWALLGMALLVPLQRGLIAMALTLGNPPGQRMLVLGFSWHDYLGVLIGLVLLAVAIVQAEAARLADENAGFV